MQYKYEPCIDDSGRNFKVTNNDIRVATCYSEEFAKLIVDALNGFEKVGLTLNDDLKASLIHVAATEGAMRVSGMNALNQQCVTEKQPLSYDDDAFFREADKLRQKVAMILSGKVPE